MGMGKLILMVLVGLYEVEMVAIVWRKGWRWLSLLFVGIPIVLMGVAISALYNDENTAMMLGMIFQSAGMMFGVFGPKKPIISSSRKKIAELEKRCEELTKRNGVDTPS